MKNLAFITFNDNILVSHIKIYENEIHQKIHLIPVCHIGTKEYFHNIVAYVGEIPCIFEGIKFSSESDNFHKPIKNINDYIESYSITCDKAWQEYGSYTKRFYRKYIGKDIKKLHKSLRKEVYKSSEKIRKIYELCKKSNFSINNLIMIQLFWCEMFKLEHQLIAIDVAKRSNWIHADFNFEDSKDQIKISEAIKRILTAPSKKVINESQKEMQLVMFSLYQSVQYDKILDYSQRRIIFANDLIDLMTSLYQTFENISPELLLNMRNEIIEDTILDLLKENNEIMIFYGAAHMINTEKFVLDKGFTFKAEQGFDVFNVNSP